MHRLLLIAAVASLAVGCTSPCEELGDRLCQCSPTGVSNESCKRQVKNMVSHVAPNKGQEAACSGFLDSCNAPGGVSFCDWVETTAGKQACGLAY